MAILNHRRYRWTPLTDAFIPGNKNRSSICTLVRETCSTMKINLRVEEVRFFIDRVLIDDFSAKLMRPSGGKEGDRAFFFFFFRTWIERIEGGEGNRLVFRFSRWNLFRNISYKAGRSNEKDSVKRKFKESSVTFS